MNAPSAKPGRGCMAWSAGCVVLLLYAGLFLALFVVIFYAEENWRGARAWKLAQADLAAKGESLDPAKLIPPPVSEAENFGALPFFQEVPDKDKYSQSVIGQTLKSVTSHLPSTKEDGAKSDSLPYLGNWQKGEVPDVTAVKSQLKTFYFQEHRHSPIPPNVTTPSGLFALICPVLGELRAANVTHPNCRFALEYNSTHPWDMPLVAITDHIAVAKALAYDERLALMSRRPDLALDDLKVTWKIHSGLAWEPLLISGLVNIGVTAIQMNVLNQGLAEHVWNDAQLATLDGDMDKIDTLSESQLCLRGEAVLFSTRLVDYLKEQRSAVTTWQRAALAIGPDDKTSWENVAGSMIVGTCPDGWLDQYKAANTRLILIGALSMVDSTDHRAYPDRGKNLFPADMGHASYWSKLVSWGAQPVVNGISKFAYSQAQLDEARIACRLERYRLAHGVYPKTLDELVPAYGAELPHDIMSGEAYRYKLNPDQTYLLYSVGWDQKDDGGNAGKTRNTDSPDWIWTNYPSMK